MSNLFRNPITFVKQKPIEKSTKVAVVSASRGAGGSFVLGQFALKEKSLVNIVELGEGSYYEAFGMERRFLLEKLCFADEAAKQAKVEDSFCSMFDMKYLVRDPKAKGPLSRDEILKLIAFAPKGKTFFDFSGVDEDCVLNLIAEMDEVYIVIDPLPSKLLKSARFIEKLRLVYPKAVFVVNKMNKGVHRPELNRFLGSDYIAIPSYSADKIYSAEYNCSLPKLE